MKYYIVVGEASGDLHASNLMQGIKNSDPDAEFRFFGGDLMSQKGGVLVKHYRKMAFMGFWEVVKNLGKISRNLKQCKADINSYKPDVVILVDYPGFNLRIAKFAKKSGFKVFYYIAPKVWAWKESRVEILKKYVDQLFVIFPFEINYFKSKGIEAIYEGNPLIDAVNNSKLGAEFSGEGGQKDKPIISLLPGSRKQEISYILPVMVSLEAKLSDFQFIIAGAPSLEPSIYEPYIKNRNIKLVYGKTHEILSKSTVAVVASGTATLEAALINVPEVVCYRGNIISMLIGWMVMKVKFISLVNIISGKEVVKELIQFRLTEKNLLKEVLSILPGEKKRDLMQSDFANIQLELGSEGSSFRVGSRMFELLKK